MQHNVRLVIGFLIGVVLILPPTQRAIRQMPMPNIPGCAIPTLAIGIALAAMIASPPASGVSPSAPTPVKIIKEKKPLTLAETLPGRLARAQEYVNLLIRDDLLTKDGHRDNYETALLRNELVQTDDWAT